MDKIAGALGFHDINFESSEFSRKFHIKCADKKFAYDVIHPRMMEFLLAAAQRGDIEPVMIYGGCCLMTDGRTTWKADELIVSAKPSAHRPQRPTFSAAEIRACFASTEKLSGKPVVHWASTSISRRCSTWHSKPRAQ